VNLRDLRLRVRALFARQRVERELHDELSFHIERETKRLIEAGVPAADAKYQAQAKFGSSTVAADQCRDERGTAIVDNSISDILYALRTFKRAPLSSLTIVFTVAIGLGVVAVLFTILNTLVFRIDTVPDIDQLYSVERTADAGENLPAFTRARFEALRSETSVFSDAYAALPDVDLRVNGRIMAADLVSAAFFPVVRVSPVLGRDFTGADDDRAGGAPVIVLSDKGWDRHFNRAKDVLGRTVLVNGAPFTIIGVMPPGFRGLKVTMPDLWAPLSRLGDFAVNLRGAEEKAAVQIIGRLKPGVSMESARAQLAAWDANQSSADAERRILGIELVPQRGTVPLSTEVLAMFTPLFIAFGLILLIGCANVANLLLARGVARQKEIGIRLSLGASRKRIVRQLMTESVLLALFAAAGGYLISRVALVTAVSWMLRVMPTDLGDVNVSVPEADWRVALFLVIAAVGATALFALIPALQATRVEPVRTLRGELVKDARPGRARNVLIAMQVFASALLLISGAIFLRSAVASSKFDPGFRTADTVLIEMLNEPKRAALLRGITTEPTITAHAAVKPALLAPPPRAFADTGAGKIPVSYKFVSAPYFDVLAIPIVRGRAFTAAETDDHPVAIVTESTARSLFPNGDGVGETVRLEADLTVSSPYGLQVNPDTPIDTTPLAPRMVTIIGVSRDAPGFRITDVKDAGVFLPISLEKPYTSVVARVHGDPDLARQTLYEHLTVIDPNLGSIITMRTVARLETFFLQLAYWVSLILGGLALLLTVSGLFSVLSYLVEQRTREIGVRMALGATSQKVARLMLAQTTRPVLYGLLAGASLAGALAALVLSTEAGATIGQIVRLADPLAYIGSVTVIVAACLIAAWVPASRAARVDPMKTLRQD
jgi:predicted permease